MGAGFDVTVVSACHFQPVAELDRDVLAGARWKHVEVATHRGLEAAWRRLRAKMFERRRPDHTRLTTDEACLLMCPPLPRLVRAAAATGAGHFHGHCTAGLAAAALASRQVGATYSFDAEDFHEEETEAVVKDPLKRAAVAGVLRAFLPGTRGCTAASPLITAAYRDRHGLDMQVVLNAFDPAMPAAPRAAREFTSADPVRLYWFSQTVGPGRGLEQMVDVVARMTVPAKMQLRGFVSGDYRERLASRAASAGVAVEFLPPGPPSAMVSLASEADLGLSLEQSFPPNRDMCLTNKIFVYLAAGLPQAMSATSAQTAFARELGDAAVVINLDDAAGSAARLDRWLASPEAFNASRAAARATGERHAWAGEKVKFLAMIQAALGHPADS